MVNEKSRKTGKALDFVSLAFLGLVLLESLLLCASSARLLERDLDLVSLAFFISLCFWRATAGTRPCVGKHSVRAFCPSAHSRLLSVLSAMDRCLALACCDNVVFVGRRPTARRIKNSVRFEVFWFGRIASGIQLRISLQMASDLRRTSSVLAGESHDLPGVGGVSLPLLAPLRTALRALRPLGLPPRALGSTLGALLLIRSLCLRLPLPLLRSTLLSLLALAVTNQTRRREIRGRIAVSTTRNTWCPDTVGIFCVKWLIVSSSSSSNNFDIVSSLRRTAT